MNENHFLSEALCLTQEQAELNRYRVGLWTQDQYEAYMHVWSINKFSSLADGWKDDNYSTPEVGRLVSLLKGRLVS